VHGLLLLDKPAGLTSHDCVRKVRRLFKTRKVGHAGTLDPLATGVLPIAVGDGTKVLQFLLAENKSYRATLKLGVTTETLDSEGEIVAVRPVPPLSETQVRAVCQSFCGVISQLPPMYSALKKDGVPLYKLARQGITVERAPREVEIHAIDLVSFCDTDITIEVSCSKGTYIRSLAHDIGEAIGCGAHITALRRLSTGAFTISECSTLEQLEATEERSSFLLSINDALRNYSAVQLDEAGVNQLKYGIPPQLQQIECLPTLHDGDLVRLLTADRLLAVARFAPQRKKEKRGDFELVRVFISDQS